MHNVTDIFEPRDDAAGDSADELDRELATAGHILHKLAEEQGLNLDELPEEDVADLLTMLHGEQVEGGSQVVNTPEQQPTKEASHMENNELTVADVAVELAKVASAQGIDLDQVSREEYHEAFEQLAEQMQQPGYFEKQAEAQEKLAEADYIGRYMAHSFMDELNNPDEELGEKIAKSRLAKEMAKDPNLGQGLPASQRKAIAQEKVRQGRVSSGRARYEGKEKLKSMLKKAPGKAKELTRALGHSMGVKGKGRALAAGAGALGAGAAAIGGGAYGAKKMMDRKKAAAEEQFEADAVELARNFLVEEGINPDTGEKIASEELTREDALAERACELLEGAGYSFDE